MNPARELEKTFFQGKKESISAGSLDPAHASPVFGLGQALQVNQQVNTLENTKHDKILILLQQAEEGRSIYY